MIQIEEWFPVYIGYVFNPFHKEIEDELTQRCLKIKKSYKKDFEEFRKKTQSMGTPSFDWYLFQNESSYWILEDQKFNRLNNWIDDQVKEYTEKLMFSRKLKCFEGWFNIYEKYDYSNYHTHIPSVISCVYFLNCEEKTAAKLLIKNRNDFHPYLGNSNMYHEAIPGKLVVFSGHLEHAAQQHNTDNPRITLAYNYDQK